MSLAEEATPFIYEAREAIERSERQIAQIQSGLELKQELADSISRVCADLQGTLERLEPIVLQSVIRQVFKKFTIDKVGRGPSQKSWVESYEFTEDIKDLLAAQQHTLVPDAGGTGLAGRPRPGTHPPIPPPFAQSP